MERKILFKAKKLSDGKWVEGSLVTSSQGTFIATEEDASVFPMTMDEVDPSTVCQFTGLKDKDGKDVYEWDILEHIKNANIKVCVEWNERGYVLKDLGEGTLHLCIQSILDDLVIVHSKFDRKEGEK